ELKNLTQDTIAPRCLDHLPHCQRGPSTVASKQETSCAQQLAEPSLPREGRGGGPIKVCGLAQSGQSLIEAGGGDPLRRFLESGSKGQRLPEAHVRFPIEFVGARERDNRLVEPP